MPKKRPRQCPKCSKGMIRNGECSNCGHKPEQFAKGKSGTDKYRSLYGRRWREAKARYLADHPLCVRCKLDGLVVAATVVDAALFCSIRPDRYRNGPSQ